MRRIFILRRGTKHNTVKHNTVKHNTVKHNTVKHNTVKHNTVKHNTVKQILNYFLLRRLSVCPVIDLWTLKAKFAM